jgi:hypothetical protein
MGYILRPTTLAPRRRHWATRCFHTLACYRKVASCWQGYFRRICSHWMGYHVVYVDQDNGRKAAPTRWTGFRSSDLEWSFGQILALGTWLPVLVEMIYILSSIKLQL